MADRNKPGASLTLAVVCTWYALLLTVLIVLAVQGGPIRDVALVGLFVVFAIAPIGIVACLRLPVGGTPSAVDELVHTVRTMQGEAGLSETAKRVLHRKEERDLLRSAIEHDIRTGDLDAALVLVEELAERFGYRDDAEVFREQIEHQRTVSRERAAADAVGKLDALIEERRWSDGYAEAARVGRLFPDIHEARALRARVEESRSAYRHALERRFLQASDDDSIDEAMELLKELDQYLTPAEAEPLQEIARGVIGKSRENLAARFRLLMQDHEYAAAIEIGQRIMQEFPNARMAQEVRELLPMLQQRVERARG